MMNHKKESQSASFERTKVIEESVV